MSRSAERREVVVRSTTSVATDVVALELVAAGDGELPGWDPGAHLDLCVPGEDGSAELVRQYSLCGDPADRDVYRLGVLREPAGTGGSAAVHERVRVGDTLHIVGPRNHFELVEAAEYRFVAGGIGITPILPMIAAVAARGAPWRLLYGGRRASSMAFTGELAAYAENVLLRPEDEHGLLDLDGFLAGREAGTHVYCCGPEPLLAAVEQRCPDDTLHVERFAPKALDVQTANEQFEVELAQSGRTVTIPADRSILHTLEDAGLVVLSSCQEGTCGTCETGVLDGRPDHRDSVLSRAEQDANDVMMICVSRSAGPRLVLDL